MAWYIVIMTTYDATRERSLGVECYTRFLISLKERGNERAPLTFSIAMWKEYINQNEVKILE